MSNPGLRRIGASQAAYSSLLIPLVALTVSTVCEGYIWHPNAVAGLAMILACNLVMFPGRAEEWAPRKAGARMLDRFQRFLAGGAVRQIRPRLKDDAATVGFCRESASPTSEPPLRS